MMDFDSSDRKDCAINCCTFIELVVALQSVIKACRPHKTHYVLQIVKLNPNEMIIL
jgi:hypothetical protein